MTSYYKQFARELSTLPPAHRPAKLREYLAEIEDPNLRAEAARYIISFPGGEDDSQPVVFVLLHGIRTAGSWQDKLAQMLEVEHQVTAIPIKFGIFNVVKFLVPPFRRSAVKLVSRHLSDIRATYPDHKLAVVAHSFGTYVIARLLEEKQHTVDRLLLCGSVVLQSFDWRAALPNATRHNIVNDVGTKDYWPALAHATSYGCGASGLFGFGNPCVTDRYHPIGHCGFFDADHMRKFWLPFLLEGRVVVSDHTAEKPDGGLFTRGVCSLPNAFIVWLTGAGVMGWAFF